VAWAQRSTATSGHLGRRGTGDVATLTVREYQSLLGWRRGLYRLTRHPIVVLGVGPFYLFVPPRPCCGAFR
jgi:omega-6 fatty acid desaturase (delta-12 desaturase)